MIRRLFTLLSALSLLLCVGTCVMWVRSHWTEDYGVKGRAGSDCVFAFSGNGWLWVAIAGEWPQSQQWSFGSQPLSAAGKFNTDFGVVSPRASRQWDVLGVEIERVNGWLWTPTCPRIPSHNPKLRITRLLLPWAWAAGVTAILPIGWTVRWSMLARKKGKPGICPACGYDLRATPDRCPECGAVPSIAKVMA